MTSKGRTGTSTTTTSSWCEISTGRSSRDAPAAFHAGRVDRLTTMQRENTMSWESWGLSLGNPATWMGSIIMLTLHCMAQGDRRTLGAGGREDLDERGYFVRVMSWHGAGASSTGCLPRCEMVLSRRQLQGNPLEARGCLRLRYSVVNHTSADDISE